METMTRELEKIAIADERWRTAAMGVLYERELLEEQITAHAVVLQQEAQRGGKDGVQALREGVAWANALDAQAVAIQGADIYNEGSDVAERMARRIMHHAGRTALSKINKQKQRETMSNVDRNRRRGFTRSRLRARGMVG